MFALRRRPSGMLLGYLADRGARRPAAGSSGRGFGAVAGRTGTAHLSRQPGRRSAARRALLGVLGAAAGVVAGRARRAGAGRSRRSPRPPGCRWAEPRLARTGRTMADLLDARRHRGGAAAAAVAVRPRPGALDVDGLTRAALESVAENTSDAQVAPLLWAAVGGVPGVLVYRGVNTLDAMIGHRSPRYARFGWAAARLDDVANYRRRPGDRRAGGGVRAAGRRVAGRARCGRGAVTRPTPEPQRRRRRGGLRRSAGRAARRPDPVPPRAGDPADPRRRPARRRSTTCAARCGCRGRCRRPRRLAAACDGGAGSAAVGRSGRRACPRR